MDREQDAAGVQSAQLSGIGHSSLLTMHRADSMLKRDSGNTASYTAGAG